MPDNFARTSNDLLLVANGINPVLRWDGLYGQMEEAGVRPPTTAPVVSGSGSGSITGTYRAYVRFVDRLGNLSDLSPVSDDVTLTSRSQVNYTSVPVPQQASVTRRQILRNLAGEELVYYVDIDTTDISSTSLNSSRTDTELQEQESQALFDADGNDIANIYGVPPDWKPLIVSHLGRVYYWGEAVYREGAVIVTFGSDQVTGLQTEWPANFVGRFFYGAGGQNAIEIESIDATTQVITLVSPWLGLTDPYLAYSIRPAPAERNLCYYSGPNMPEAVPARNSVDINEGQGGDPTAAFSMASFVYFVRERQIHRLTAQADPGTDGFVFLAGNRGCVNNRCVVVNGDVAWMLDEQGVYSFRGGPAEDISQQIQGIFRGTNPRYGLNWDASRFWHATYDPDNNVVRFFVTLSGDYLPRNALCFQTVLQRWWVERYPVPIGSSCIGRGAPEEGGWRLSSQTQLYLGSRATKVYSLQPGTSLDHAAPSIGTTSGDVASAGPLTLTCKNSIFNTTATVGARVYITSGPGAGQDRLIVSFSSNVLGVDVPWLVLPTSASKFAVGGIDWNWRSGPIDYIDSETSTPRRLEVTWDPVASDDEMVVRRYQGSSKTAMKNLKTVSADQRNNVSAQKGSDQNRAKLNDSEGWAELSFDGHRERLTKAPMFVSAQLSGVATEPITIREIAASGTERGGGKDGDQ